MRELEAWAFIGRGVQYACALLVFSCVCAPYPHLTPSTLPSKPSTHHHYLLPPSLLSPNPPKQTGAEGSGHHQGVRQVRRDRRRPPPHQPVRGVPASERAAPQGVQVQAHRLPHGPRQEAQDRRQHHGRVPRGRADDRDHPTLA